MPRKKKQKWWGFAKEIIRQYPQLEEKDRELRIPSISIDLSGAGVRGGELSSSITERLALRELPPAEKANLEAVRFAVKATEGLPDGRERLFMIRLVFWDQTHTLQGAAIKCHVSYTTAVRWHGDFIRTVAKKRGLFD